MVKNTNAGKIIVKVEKMDDGRIAEIFEVNQPRAVKHLNFSDFIKWCHGNADVPSYDITYNGSKHFISLLDWLDIQKDLNFINTNGKVLR